MVTFKQCISHKQALNTEQIWQTKELSTSTQFKCYWWCFDKTHDLWLVLWQVTKMQTASTSIIWISGECHAVICLGEHLCGHWPTNESTQGMRDGSLVCSLCGFPTVSTPGICRLNKPWPDTTKSPLPYCNKVVEDKKINFRTVN